MQGRSLTACSAILAAVLLLTGCGTNLQSPKTLTLQVTGTEGTLVTGQYIVTDGGQSTRHAVDREVPFSIEVSGHDISCMLQKLGGKGTVRLELLVDGERVAFAGTTESYGNVGVDTP